MKVYAYLDRISLDTLTLQERPDPVPGPQDVVLRMRAATLNYRDLAIARGNYHARVSAPLIPVSDGAGEVVFTGSEVTRVKVGDLACPAYLPNWISGPPTPAALRHRLGGPNDGVLSELVCVHENALVRAPSHLDPVEAATLPVAAVTAWQSLYQVGQLLPGQTLLILGAGGVSIAGLQFAAAGGARVIAVTRRPEQRARLQALGASEVIVSRESGDWLKHVKELTDGQGVDVVLDVLGGSLLADSVAATDYGGLIHLVGYAAGTCASFDIFEAIRHAVTIRVATAGHRQSFEALVRVMERQKIKPPVDRVFPVKDFRAALDYLAGGGRFGKVGLSFDEATWN